MGYLRPFNPVINSISLSPVSPTISLFLVELEKSADALQDYGVLVGKVTVVLGAMCAPSVIEVNIKAQSFY